MLYDLAYSAAFCRCRETWSLEDERMHTENVHPALHYLGFSSWQLMKSKDVWPLSNRRYWIWHRRKRHVLAIDLPRPLKSSDLATLLHRAFSGFLSAV